MNRNMPRQSYILLAIVTGWLRAQSAAPLENHDSPMRLGFTCTEDDIRESGLICSQDEPCPVYLELTGGEALLSRVFITGNLHTSDATLYSIVLASEDNGKTWTEPFPRIRFGSLEQIQFIDFENGWISGAVLQGVPRDPFFLLTNDGGKTWNRKPVSQDSRFGVVEQFWFDSQTTGKMLIDTKTRHELYRTETGGESWSLEQTSQAPIAFRVRTGSESSIRLRPDAKIHGYHVEKRQGEKWEKVADFLVDAGSCKE